MLNLLYSKYVDAGDGTASLILNSEDTRALLYEISSGVDPKLDGIGFDRQSYYVARASTSRCLVIQYVSYRLDWCY